MDLFNIDRYVNLHKNLFSLENKTLTHEYDKKFEHLLICGILNQSQINFLIKLFNYKNKAILDLKIVLDYRHTLGSLLKEMQEINLITGKRQEDFENKAIFLKLKLYLEIFSNYILLKVEDILINLRNVIYLNTQLRETFLNTNQTVSQIKIFKFSYLFEPSNNLKARYIRDLRNFAIHKNDKGNNDFEKGNWHLLDNGSFFTEEFKNHLHKDIFKGRVFLKLNFQHLNNAIDELVNESEQIIFYLAQKNNITI